MTVSYNPGDPGLGLEAKAVDVKIILRTISCFLVLGMLAMLAVLADGFGFWSFLGLVPQISWS